jgi:hypothetical protein
MGDSLHDRVPKYFSAPTGKRISSLGNLSPAVYAKNTAPQMQRDGMLRNIEGSPSRANRAQTKPGLSSWVDETRGSANEGNCGPLHLGHGDQTQAITYFSSLPFQFLNKIAN